MWTPKLETTAAQVVTYLNKLPETIATAESLTGGLLSGVLTSVPGASGCFQGGVTSYATSIKAKILGVEPELLETKGAVDPEVAKQMAQNVRELFCTDWAISTTGVAGPEPQDGKEVGTVYIAVANENQTYVKACSFTGSRAEIRYATVAAALEYFQNIVADDI
ncbi:CinA family protein [Gleimia sp. 6138-11-ORH1]|uniref:CinA family protein n=1 Tax=Gleimia sp. 6138-11-ORH1 TaxID=2973937 RepID=UPI002167723E|nr:CinA family protein [Gleimia sp. 6138-11-ORH1]MCS4484236.1 CinA family protein [Gleimia sp. 6138-11-ORH1]